MPRAKRCTFKQGNRRCTFDGDGQPPLCDAHRVALAEAARPKAPIEVLGQTVADFLSGRPINREQTLGAVSDLASQWAGNIGAGYRPEVRAGETEGSVHHRAQSGQDPLWQWILNAQKHAQGQQQSRQQPQQPHSPQEIEARKLRAARRIFGFKDGVDLTDEMIKKRHRELMKKHHPDRGGSTETTMVINAARDVLVASL